MPRDRRRKYSSSSSEDSEEERRKKENKDIKDFSERLKAKVSFFLP